MQHNELGNELNTIQNLNPCAVYCQTGDLQDVKNNWIKILKARDTETKITKPGLSDNLFRKTCVEISTNSRVGSIHFRMF